MNKIYIISILLAASVGYLSGSSASNVELVDNDEFVNIETVLAEVCKKESFFKHSNADHKQISRFSTIETIRQKLKEYRVSKGEYSKCANRYKGVAFRLLEVLDIGNENVCAENKLGLVKQFHLDYVSKIKKDVKRQKELGFEIPRILKNFFINYVTLVSNRCEQNALSSLQEASKKFAEEVGQQVIESDLSIMDEPNFNQMFSVWNLIDALPWENDKGLSAYLLHRSNRVLMRVSNLDALPRMQGFCWRIQPIYKRTILPLLDLVYMGYYPTSGDFEKAILSDAKATMFMKYIQLCQEILPVEFHQKSSLKSVEVQLIPHIREILTRTMRHDHIHIDVVVMNQIWPSIDNSFDGVKDLLEISGGRDLEQMVKTTKNNIDIRNKNIESFIKMLSKFLRNDNINLKTFPKLIVPESLAEKVTVPDEAAEKNILKELAVEEHNEVEGESRMRRSIGGLMKNTTHYILSFLLYVIYLMYYALSKLPASIFEGKVKVFGSE